MISTQIMKPSDEAQNVEPTNVQSAAASQTPSNEHRDAAGDAEPPEPARHLARVECGERRADDHGRGAGGARRRDGGVVRGERGGLEREQRGAAEHDDAGEEPVRVEADDPRVQAAEEPEERERGADEERAGGLRMARSECEREHAEGT